MLGSQQKSLQELYLDDLIQNNPQVSIYLRHGIRLKGEITAYDDRSVYLKNGNNVQLVYKSWVSAIQPEKEFAF